jgi:hypothetical protein
MPRCLLLSCLLLSSGTALAGASVPRDGAPVDEAALSKAAAAGTQVAELAQLCGWENDPALVLQARTAALMLATQAVQPEKRRYEVMRRVLASNAMAGAERAAKRQVGNGGCADAGEKSKWSGLRKHTLTLLANPAAPTQPATPATAAAPAAATAAPAPPAPPSATMKPAAANPATAAPAKPPRL